MNSELLSQEDWSSLFDTAFDINTVYANWLAHFCAIIEKYIPLKIVIIRSRDKPWMNGDVRRAIRKRNRLLRIHNNRSNDHSWKNYRKERNLTTKLIRSAKQRFYHKINKDLSSPSINVKKWWSISK